MQGALTCSPNLEERLSECRKFAQKIGRPVEFKDRHNGYQLRVPGGKAFGFIRYNVKGAREREFCCVRLPPGCRTSQDVQAAA